MSEAKRKIVVRAAGDSADVEQVRTLMREYAEDLARGPAGPAHLCITSYESELAGLPGPYVAPGALYLGLAGDEAAGCVALKPVRGMVRREKHGVLGGALELKRLWVRPAYRGLGLGGRLVKAAIDHARMAGAGAIFLDTVPAAMPEANRLYGAMGFRKTERYNENRVEGVEFFQLLLGEAVSSPPA